MLPTIPPSIAMLPADCIVSVPVLRSGCIGTGDALIASWGLRNDQMRQRVVNLKAIVWECHMMKKWFGAVWHHSLEKWEYDRHTMYTDDKASNPICLHVWRSIASKRVWDILFIECEILFKWGKSWWCDLTNESRKIHPWRRLSETNVGCASRIWMRTKIFASIWG